jgi:hypothetical protein
MSSPHVPKCQILTVPIRVRPPDTPDRITCCRYNFNWYFQQDGTIEFEIKLTGELSTNLLSPGEDDPEYGTLVAPGVNAQHHQHMFCARLDMAVDDPDGGAALVVSEVTGFGLRLGFGFCGFDDNFRVSGFKHSLGPRHAHQNEKRLFRRFCTQPISELLHEHQAAKPRRTY